ncbi:MAG: replication-associated recombination protein A [Candidatus Latescibacteria bacterium]|nr:replication-associated recombination protein A [Candidatus Latescibacterota bacterium]
MNDEPELFPGEPGRRATRAPLADRMRPRSFDEFLGQADLLKSGGLLRSALERGELPSVIFWGPPGSGKTTLARLIAEASGGNFVAFSAVTSGVKEVREVIERARVLRKARSVPTILFVDEIHRFNKAQQDAFLPHVENGTIVLMGATTENPSFEVNTALLSRMKVIVLPALSANALVEILERAVADKERGLGRENLLVADGDLRLIARLSGGDARIALNILEGAAMIGLGAARGARRAGAKPATGAGAQSAAAGVPPRPVPIGEAEIREAAQRKTLPYDRVGEEHYNIISALHKCLRGSDPDAGLYWLARMLEAGEDPLYIARRLVRFASEDVGLADPEALRLAVAVKEAVHFLGMPECNTALAELTVYLALAPKSNSVYQAYLRASRDALEHPPYPVPLHIRNAPTKLMKDLGYGEGYEYAHEFEDAIVGQGYLPDELRDARYWEGVPRGKEAELVERLKRINAEKAKRRGAGQEKPGG